eukprot:SAG31_NODE_3522_length_4162_cov_14.600541_3_plen_119_part_00
MIFYPFQIWTEFLNKPNNTTTTIIICYLARRRAAERIRQFIRGAHNRDDVQVPPVSTAKCAVRSDSFGISKELDFNNTTTKVVDGKLLFELLDHHSDNKYKYLNFSNYVAVSRQTYVF